jgi:hypothetical protein
MPLVYTTKGLIERELLIVKDIIEEGDNYRTIATEWYLDGEMVRRDAHAMILSGQALFGDQAKM